LEFVAAFGVSNPEKRNRRLYVLVGKVVALRGVILASPNVFPRIP
jgi:hypothetical protein